MLKSLARFSSLILLSNLLFTNAQRIQSPKRPPKPTRKAEKSEWGKNDRALKFRGSNINDFSVSGFSDTYEPNTDYTGILFYDMGTCPTKGKNTRCRQMRDGYVIFQKNEKLTKLRNQRKLKSLGEVTLLRFFKINNVNYLNRLVNDHGVKMAMFNLKDGVLNTKLSTEIMTIAVDNSPAMNAYEYALLDSIRNLWVKNGLRKTHMVPKVQKVMKSRSRTILKSVACLDLGESFMREYAPRVREMPKARRVVRKKAAPTNRMHHGRKFRYPTELVSRKRMQYGRSINFPSMSVNRQVCKLLQDDIGMPSDAHQITINMPLIIEAGGAEFTVGDPLNSANNHNVKPPKAEDRIQKTVIMGTINNKKSPGEVNNNLLGDSQKLIVNSDSLIIQELPSTPENWAYFDCVLIKDGDQVNFNSPNALYLTEADVGKNYAQNYVAVKELGGGHFIERHDNEHWHYPMDEASGGYYLVGKTFGQRDGPEQFHIQVAAMKIPYGYGVLTNPWVWHSDVFLTGKWRMAYGYTDNNLTLDLYQDIENPVPVTINKLR